MPIDSRLPNFRAMSTAERLDAVTAAAGLAPGSLAAFGQTDVLGHERASGMIENVVGTFELPLGIAANFQINGRDVLVPMAVEEPSIVAAASFMAKLVRSCGGFETSSSAPLMRAQVQVLRITP